MSTEARSKVVVLAARDVELSLGVKPPRKSMSSFRFGETAAARVTLAWPS
ncbi:Uncharacterised protein [Mycobacteroides abscessus subsp. abscessus]|nr:Uncharacterised protein [Mycobacteroides abscessus subsp. abscessus]